MFDGGDFLLELADAGLGNMACERFQLFLRQFRQRPSIRKGSLFAGIGAAHKRLPDVASEYSTWLNHERNFTIPISE